MNKFGKNILLVTASNIVRLLASVAVGLVVPKLLSTVDFGFYKTFTLYVTYIGIFSIGIIDGIYLKYGGVDYKQLNKNKFRMYTKFLFLVQLFFSIILFIFSILFFKGENQFVFILVALNLLAQQFLTYFMQVSQLTSQFKVLSVFNLIWSLSTILGVGVIYLIPQSNYQIYLYTTVGINYLLLIYYLIRYYQIIFGEKQRIKDNKEELKSLIKLGWPLLIANLVSTLILSLDRQIIQLVFDTKTYAIYAFAYSLFSIANTFITAISMVLYPILKKMNRESLALNYEKSISLMLMVVYAALALYFPLNEFIKWYLDKYVDSLMVFRIILPGLAMSSCVTVVMQNHYKVLDKNKLFFLISLLVLTISLIVNIIVVSIWKNPLFVSISSVFCLLIWYILTELLFKKQYRASLSKNYFYLILIATIFYLLTGINNNLLAGGIYISIYIVLTMLIYKKVIMQFIKFKIKQT